MKSAKNSHEFYLFINALFCIFVQTDRQTETETERQRETETETDRETAERQIQRDTERQKQTETETEKHERELSLGSDSVLTEFKRCPPSPHRHTPPLHTAAHSSPSSRPAEA